MYVKCTKNQVIYFLFMPMMCVRTAIVVSILKGKAN